MEVVRSPSNRDKRTRRPKFIIGGGGGVEGLLVLGGSLAIAGLVALFTITTSRRRKSEEEVDHNKFTIDGNNNNGANNMDKISKETTCFDDGSEKVGGLEVVLDQEGHDIQLVQGGSHGGSNVDLYEEKGVLEADEDDDQEQPQHEILVLSDDSTPPESVVSRDDYTGSHSLDEEKGEEEEEDDDDEGSEVTERSSSRSSAVAIWPGDMIEEALLPVKEFAVIDPNYETIAKEQNSFNCGLEHKFEISSSAMFGRQHLPPPSVVVHNHLTLSSHPLVPLTKAQVLWLIVPVVLLTLLLALIHFLVVDDYVIII